MSTATETTAKSSATATFSCALLEHDLEIPMDIRSLADFRQWALSKEFPERGRIDFIGHRIEVSMSPEDLSSHGTPKVEILSVLAIRNKAQRMGEILRRPCARFQSDGRTLRRTRHCIRFE